MIAIDPEYQGIGAGTLLLQDAENAARQRGFLEMHLTVHPENEQAICFYEHLGWEKNHQDGLWNGKMRKTLAPIGDTNDLF